MRIQGLNESFTHNRECCIVGGTMQSYENKSKEQSLGKRILLEFIDFLKYKIENDRLTLGEMDSIVRIIEDQLVLSGSVEDFANHYHRSKDCVKVLICRKLIAKPVRKVFYPFRHFLKIIPNSWLHINR